MIGGRKSKPGFSLVEMLIVVFLFSISAVILSQLFLSYNQLHRKVANLAILGQDMRFSMELLVRSARNNQIDYSAEPLAARMNAIRLKTSSGGTIDIALQPTYRCQDTTVARCLAMSLDGGTTWQPITGTRVELTSFDVYVRPLKSPFTPRGTGYDSNNQPEITFNIGLKYNAQNPKDSVTLQSQTTVASRVYVR
jgi:prepilin-type N-terminal cleavage/methylation domain-containing protein